MDQKEIIKREVNTLKPFGLGYAPISIGDFRRRMNVDYSVFKKSMDEKMKLFTLKKQCIKSKMSLVGRYQF